MNPSHAAVRERRPSTAQDSPATLTIASGQMPTCGKAYAPTTPAARATAAAQRTRGSPCGRAAGAGIARFIRSVSLRGRSLRPGAISGFDQFENRLPAQDGARAGPVRRRPGRTSGRPGTAARGSVLQRATRSSGASTLTSPARHTAKVAGSPGASTPSLSRPARPPASAGMCREGRAHADGCVRLVRIGRGPHRTPGVQSCHWTVRAEREWNPCGGQVGEAVHGRRPALRRAWLRTSLPLRPRPRQRQAAWRRAARRRQGVRDQPPSRRVRAGCPLRQCGPAPSSSSRRRRRT